LNPQRTTRTQVLFSSGHSSEGGARDSLVVLYSPAEEDLGRTHALGSEPLSIGRDPASDIVLHSDLVSRRHARVVPGSHGAWLEDLGSKNGTSIGGRRLASGKGRLEAGDRIELGGAILKYLSGADIEAQFHELIYDMTVTDGLTGVGNRRALESVLRREATRAERHGRELSLLILDLDHFKRLNDTHGHLAGDHVLREFAKLLAERVRPGDELARSGGEEFVLVLPETGLAGALELAEELRRRVEEARFDFRGEELSVTASVGAAMFRTGMTVEDLQQAADTMLYRAKARGRNQVHPPPMSRLDRTG
jgi:diguanylate cyclase (GGDEF)-like protein